MLLLFRVSIKFITHDGKLFTAKAKVGDNLLDVIIDNDFDFDGFGKQQLLLIFAKQVVDFNMFQCN